MLERKNTYPLVKYAHPLLDRSELLLELSRALKKYSHVSIIGHGGSGKTALINQYLQNFKDFSNRNISYYYGYELDLDNKKLAAFQNGINSKQETLIIIDEFETIQSSQVLEQVTWRLKEGRKYKAKTVIISRNHLFPVLENNSYIIDLNKVKLSRNEIRQIINRSLQNQNIDEHVLDNLESVLEEVGANPLTIMLASDLIKHGHSPLELRSIINSDLNYHNRLLESIFEGNKIFLPEQPKIITDIIFINNSLLDRVSRNPKSIYEISPRQFEELVAELFEKKGYNVKITQQTQDGGKDLIILEDKIIGNMLCYVECKKYAPDNPVGVRVVRELFGTVTADRATAGIIVTSSYFSEPAYNFTEKIKHQMNLIDYVKLNGIINNVTKQQPLT